jgi:hypothetical protein
MGNAFFVDFCIFSYHLLYRDYSGDMFHGTPHFGQFDEMDDEQCCHGDMGEDGEIMFGSMPDVDMQFDFSQADDMFRHFEEMFKTFGMVELPISRHFGEYHYIFILFHTRPCVCAYVRSTTEKTAGTISLKFDVRIPMGNTLRLFFIFAIRPIFWPPGGHLGGWAAVNNFVSAL